MTDFDGDGYTDLIEGGSYAQLDQGKLWFDVSITYASKGSETAFDLARGGIDELLASPATWTGFAWCGSAATERR